MIPRKYTDWQNIMLDSSVVMSLLRSRIDDKVPTCNFVAKLLDNLSSKKSNGRKNRNFFISSITISELLSKTDNETKATKIVKALGSENVIFCPYDNDIAEYVVKNYYKQLGVGNLTDLAKEFSWPDHHLSFGRQWIEKDLMIIGTAQYLACDTILTIDKNTMFPLAEKVGYFCGVAYEEYFQHSEDGKNIFNYNKPKLQNIKNAKKQQKPPKGAQITKQTAKK